MFPCLAKTFSLSTASSLPTTSFKTVGRYANVHLTLTKLRMADEFEDDQQDDRKIDKIDFVHHQYQKFMLEYRSLMSETEQCEMQAGFSAGFDSSCATFRKLGKAKGTVHALRESSVGKDKINQLDEFSNRIQNCEDEFIKMISLKLSEVDIAEQNSSEYDFRTSLPLFDQDDMNLFGLEITETSSNSGIDNNASDTTNAICKSSVNLKIQELKLLVDSVLDDLCDFLKSCDISHSFLINDH
ncbi:hypothetical protein T4C_8911 [Trichinella pseudospiralis]|uniref:Uncharacterized protein n=1 Tax=Trichinella pseudospiralis TaxID=6337 RepID=A0A0V1K2K1_TRIPS|nr:hypothetical protein T4C_8911 [Trichinella pseudospiralis]